MQRSPLRFVVLFMGLAMFNALTSWGQDVPVPAGVLWLLGMTVGVLLLLWLVQQWIYAWANRPPHDQEWFHRMDVFKRWGTRINFAGIVVAGLFWVIYTKWNIWRFSQ